MEGKLVKGLSLKASVDVEKNRVVFIESDEDFIDILLSFLTRPLGSIIRLIRCQPPLVGIGCMDNLYASVENLDIQLFQTEACKTMLLHPQNAAADLCGCLKLTIDDCEQLPRFFCESVECSTSQYKLSSHYRNAVCGCGKLMSREIMKFKGENKEIRSDACSRGVFVKGRTRMMVSDELKIMPPLTATSLSLLSKLGIADGSDIEERAFNLGVYEVLNLLKSSLVSGTPLTDTLLKKNNEDYDQGSYTKFDRGNFTRFQMAEASSNKYKSISAKLIVSKSRKMVCYAEVHEDFVDLLFSFLTIPLGHVAKEMKNHTRGCINNLYSSVQDPDADQYLKSNDHKAMLISPKLAPCFKIGNQPLCVEECMNQPSFSYRNKRVGITVVRLVDPRSDFVKGPAMFTVTDNLIITPISPVSCLSVLSKLKVPFSDIEERVVHIGKTEASRLLVASFVTKSALTNAFMLEEPKIRIKIDPNE